MPRYVLLWHEMPSDSGRSSHGDFMLERNGVLSTWALEMLPAAWQKQLGLPCDCANDRVAATRLDDHRIAYLAYEGPVSGNRGSVKRVAAGEYEIVQNLDRQFEAVLSGDLKGRVQLTKKNCPDSATWWLQLV